MVMLRPAMMIKWSENQSFLPTGDYELIVCNLMMGAAAAEDGRTLGPSDYGGQRFGKATRVANG